MPFYYHEGIIMLLSVILMKALVEIRMLHCAM